MAVLTKITSRSLADNAVTSAHVQGDVIAAGDIAAGAIGSSELADDAVGAAQLASDAVVNASVAAGAAITFNKLEANPMQSTNAKTIAATYTNEQEQVFGSAFTTTGSTVTGDVTLKSLTDETVTLSGTGTITGSGGRILMEGVDKGDSSIPKTGGGFTGPIQAPHIMTGRADFGNLTATDFTLANPLSTGSLTSGVTFPAGHCINVKTKELEGSIASGGNSFLAAVDSDANDLHIDVAEGNLILAWVSGGMINSETGVTQYRTFIRFQQKGLTFEDSDSTDYWCTSHIGGNFSPDLYHPGLTMHAGHIARFTGTMYIKGGTMNSGAHSTTISSQTNDYGPRRITAMEIQQ